MAISCIDIGTGFSSYVFGSLVQPDGKIIAGGSYTQYNGVSENYAVRLNTNGDKDTSFNIGSGFGAYGIRTVGYRPDTKIIMGGDFTTFNGSSQNGLIRLNSDGSKDTSFNIGTGFNTSSGFGVLSSAQYGTSLYVGGGFTTFTGTTQRGLIRLNTDGSKDTSFNIGTGFDSSGAFISSIYVQSDNKVLVGGSYTSFNGTTQRGLIRLNTDGSKDVTFNIGTGFSYSNVSRNIFAIAQQTDNKLLIGGFYVQYSGISQNYLIRLNSDGTKDTSFNIGIGFNDSVRSVVIQPDGKILVGGDFTTYKGLTQNRIIRLNTDGSKDTSFDIGTGFGPTSSSSVYSINLQADGSLIVTGEFISYNGNSANRIVKLSPAGAFLNCIIPTPTPTPTNTTTPTQTPTKTPTQTPTQTVTNTPTNTITPTNTVTPTHTATQTPTPTNTVTPSQTPSSPPIVCGLGLTTGAYYYTDCCNNFVQGTDAGLNVSFDYTKSFAGVIKLDTRTTVVCITPTVTSTPTNTPTNTVTPTQTPTNTVTPTPNITPSITPSNTPVTRLKNDCDVITIFDLGISCNVIQSPTESDPLSGILSLNVTGGTAPYSFIWNGIPGNQTLFGIPAGSYEVVVTDYKCADGSSDYTATTICELAGPLPTSTPTMTPTPSQTPPVQCVDLCFIAIAPFGIPNEGPIQFVCDGTQNGRFRWTSDSRLDIIWNPINNRWEIYLKNTMPPVPYTLGGGIVASTTFDLIPDSAWDVFGGDIDYSITMTRGECPFVIPLQVSVDVTNTSCQDLTNCNGSLTILAEDGYPPYQYSIDGGLTYSTDYIYNSLCPNTYLVKVVDSFNNVYNTNVSIGYDSQTTTYQLTLVPGNATVSTVPNVSKTIYQPVTLVVNPPLPVGVSVTFGLISTALRTINSPGDANSSVDWQVRKNGEFVVSVVSPTTTVSQGTRPFCSVNDTQLINSTDYSSANITITNGDVITMTSITTDTITNGQVSSQTNCTTNIKTQISAAIITPEVVGNNCSTVVGSSTQIVTNELTYVPVVVVTPLNFDAGYSCGYNPNSTVVSISNIVGGTTPYQISTTAFSSQAAALANTSWVNSNSMGTAVSTTQDNTYWLVIKDSTGTVLAKSVTTNCVIPPQTCVDPKFNGGVLVINQQSDGKILTGGAFTSYNINQAVANLARLNTNGSLDTAFTPSPGFTSGLVNDVAIQSNGKIIVGGSFVSYNGFAQKYLVRLNTDGARDTSFNFGPGITQFNGFVNTIAIQDDGQILVGGAFTDFESTSINPNQQNRIVRLNSTNGSKDPSFVIGSGFGDAVNVIKIQSDGKILVGGGYTTYKSLTQRYLIRLNTDGSKDTTFNVGSNLSSTGLNGQVKSIAIQSDGKILVGGLFTTYFGVSQRFITRLNTDGSLDSSFNIGNGFDNSVESIFVQSDGKILVGGGFTTYKGLSQKYIARLNTDGSLDTTFIISDSFNSAVFDIYVKSDGNIAVGGVFTGYNGNNNALRFATLGPTGQLLVCDCIDC